MAYGKKSKKEREKDTLMSRAKTYAKIGGAGLGLGVLGAVGAKPLGRHILKKATQAAEKAKLAKKVAEKSKTAVSPKIEGAAEWLKGMAPTPAAQKAVAQKTVTAAPAAQKAVAQKTVTAAPAGMGKGTGETRISRAETKPTSTSKKKQLTPTPSMTPSFGGKVTPKKYGTIPVPKHQVSGTKHFLQNLLGGGRKSKTSTKVMPGQYRTEGRGVISDLLADARKRGAIAYTDVLYIVRLGEMWMFVNPPPYHTIEHMRRPGKYYGTDVQRIRKRVTKDPDYQMRKAVNKRIAKTLRRWKMPKKAVAVEGPTFK